MGRTRRGKKFWAAVNQRRSARWSHIGRQFEREVLQLLREAHDADDAPIFTKVTLHRPYSGADYAGKDFTVVRTIDGQSKQCSFGVTISQRRNRDAGMLHPNVPQFCFPIGTKPETIIARVLALFDTPASQLLP